MDSRYIGDLHYTRKDGKPVLLIGHNLLVGKEVLMDKALVLLEKCIKEDNTGYTVKSIIKKKLLFKIRPKPIVNLSDLKPNPT